MRRSMFLATFAVAALGSLLSGPCQAGFLTVVGVENKSATETYHDISTVWIGTGGITSAGFVQNTQPAGSTITVSHDAPANGKETVHVIFGPGGLAPGKNFLFSFNSDKDLPVALDPNNPGGWSQIVNGVVTLIPFVQSGAGQNVEFTIVTVAAVPEPASMMLMGLGVVGISLASRRLRTRSDR